MAKILLSVGLVVILLLALILLFLLFLFSGLIGVSFGGSLQAIDLSGPLKALALCMILVILLVSIGLLSRLFKKSTES